MRQHASALERKKQRNWSAAQGNSLKNDKFDYAEMAITTSSMSTPTNDNGESPFSRDSLGDTVIHLDKVRGLGAKLPVRLRGGVLLESAPFDQAEMSPCRRARVQSPEGVVSFCL